MIFGVCDTSYISLARQTLPESQKIRCGFNLSDQVGQVDVIFLLFLGSSKLAPGAAQKQPGAARELPESSRQAQEAQEQPRTRPGEPRAPPGMTRKVVSAEILYSKGFLFFPVLLMIKDSA